MNTCSCGQPLPPEDKFCSTCGKPAAAKASLVLAPTAFQWNWALAAIPITAGVVLALSIAVGIVLGATGIAVDKESGGAAIGATVLLASMFVGGVIVGRWSPERTIREPGVGISAALLPANLVAGDRGAGLFTGWILPFAVGAAGAKLGEWIQSRSDARR